uniref:Uncharacterized protein n=1 Tax=Alexandrium monilatum TaxID=311494 RepID=A0A7S4UER9_9DINO
MPTVTVHLDPSNDLLSIDIEVPAGTTVARLKEELCKQDPTGGASPESFRVCAAARPGVVLHDTAVVGPELGSLALLLNGGDDADSSALVPGEDTGMEHQGSAAEAHAAAGRLSAKELKHRLRELQVDFTGCSEKAELEALLARAQAPGGSGAGALPEPGSRPAAAGPPAAAVPGQQRATQPLESLGGGLAAGKGRLAAEEPLIQEVAGCGAGDDGAGADVTEIRNLARGGALGPGRLLLRGHDFWQELLPEHVTKAGLEFHVALDTGCNLARKPGKRHDHQPRALPEEDPAYVAVARCIPDSEPAQEDEAEVEKAIKAACSWGRRGRLRRLLVSCFVPARCCLGALCEAAQRGHEEIVGELLRAGVPPGARDAQKTALHFACEQGHEGVARQLLGARADLCATDSSGRTPCELAREQDLGMLAKRLEKQFL